MNNKNLVIWGAGSQALVVHEFVKREDFNLKAVVDVNSSVKSPFSNIPIFTNQKDLLTFLRDDRPFFIVAIGGHKGKERLDVHNQLISCGLQPLNAIHPSSIIAQDAVIGEGNQILMNTAVGTKTQIGTSAIINSSSSIDHECKIGNGVHIGPGATLAGLVELGDYSFIGTGAVVLPRIKIGMNSIVGAGAVVTKNVPDNVVAFGNPCKIIRPNP